MPKSGGRVDKRQFRIGAVAVGVVLVCGWGFTDLRPFSSAATRALLIVAGVVIVVATARRERPPDAARSGPRQAPGYRTAIAVWSAAAAAVVAWEVIALRGSPRSEHPTISYLIENVEHQHLVRLALFAVWIWVGWRLAS